MFCTQNSDLQEQISLSSTPSPKVKVLDSVLDVKAWLTPSLENMHGHSGPHCFKFIPVTEGDTTNVLMYYRNWTSDPWCETSEALQLLKVKI